MRRNFLALWLINLDQNLDLRRGYMKISTKMYRCVFKYIYAYSISWARKCILIYKTYFFIVKMSYWWILWKKCIAKNNYGIVSEFINFLKSKWKQKV